MHGWIGESVQFPEVWVAFIYSWSECGEGSQWQFIPSWTIEHLASPMVAFLCRRCLEPSVLAIVTLCLVFSGDQYEAQGIFSVHLAIFSPCAWHKDMPPDLPALFLYPTPVHTHTQNERNNTRRVHQFAQTPGHYAHLLLQISGENCVASYSPGEHERQVWLRPQLLF